MSSLTLKLSSFLLSSSSHSSPLSSSPATSYIPPSCALRFPRKLSNYRGRFTVIRASENDNKSSPTAGDSKPPNGTLPKSRREILLEYVQNVQPEFMEMFVKRAPPQVAENLAQLMYSVLMTGYMFRNAQYRLELQQSLEQVALPEPQEKKDVPDYAPGTQKKVSGEVIRWNNISGPETIDAVKYIELLEAEIEELNRQVARKSANGQNELLEYLKTLEPQNIKELTSSAGEDVVLAMNTFIKRLLAVSDPSQMKLKPSGLSKSALLVSGRLVVGGGFSFPTVICFVQVRLKRWLADPLVSQLKNITYVDYKSLIQARIIILYSMD
ncbi:hypothetical protein DH2020_034867 [Rehmannia glutinosa]|uniref:Uncharacterized protein n=1 Tax=Rehmannia glutinosa TaxID=99300 RepID=A0ABR0VBG8_REHGL